VRDDNAFWDLYATAVFELTKNDVHVVRCANAEIVHTADRRK
jgi:hypothetical protein